MSWDAMGENESQRKQSGQFMFDVTNLADFISEAGVTLMHHVKKCSYNT